MLEKCRRFIITLCFMMALTTAPVMAQTREFDFTATVAEEGKTKPATKADSEQSAYFTITHFTYNGAIILFSGKSAYTERTGALFVNESYRSSLINHTTTRDYQTTAHAGHTYYLNYDNYGNIDCWITGRYTP